MFAVFDFFSSFEYKEVQFESSRTKPYDNFSVKGATTLQRTASSSIPLRVINDNTKNAVKMCWCSIPL